MGEPPIYEVVRNGYNNMMNENLKKETPRSEALAQSPLALARASLKTHLEKGNRVKPMQMARTTEAEDLPPLVRKREGVYGPFSDTITLKTPRFGILSNAETIRKGKGRGKGRGKGNHPGGSAGGSTNAVDYLYSKKVEIQQVRCHFCQEENIEGTHKYVN